MSIACAAENDRLCALFCQALRKLQKPVECTSNNTAVLLESLLDTFGELLLRLETQPAKQGSRYAPYKRHR